MSRRFRAVVSVRALVLLGLLGLGTAARPARADLGSFGRLTVGVAILLGTQPDERSCEVGGQSRNFPGTSTCLLFAGGVEGTFLYRGRIGASLAVVGVSGQSAIAQGGSLPGGAGGPPAFPDRVSVPLLLDLRPLAFLPAAGNRGYLARFLHGVRLGLGPSFELVRTASDSSIEWGSRIGAPAQTSIGLHGALDVEVPLHAAATSGLSLRLSTRLLYVPLVPLNDGQVLSAPFAVDPSGPPIGSRLVGYGARGQLFLGVIYYL